MTAACLAMPAGRDDGRFKVTVDVRYSAGHHVPEHVPVGFASATAEADFHATGEWIRAVPIAPDTLARGRRTSVGRS